jgi:hypothetical protein
MNNRYLFTPSAILAKQYIIPLKCFILFRYGNIKCRVGGILCILPQNNQQINGELAKEELGL